jgi:L-lactate dehydrogenase complex protein LldG
LPAVGASVADRIALFAKNSSELRTTFERVDSIDAAAAKLKEIADAEGWRRVATHAGSLTDRAVASLAIPVVRTDGGYKVEDLERCDAGVTSCDALIAQTGSVLLTSASAGGRALSILPPHHVVIATVNQLLPDLSEAYALVHERYASKWPSIMCIITGPSRTGDIERILVLGAHGPKELTVLLIAPPSKPGAT